MLRKPLIIKIIGLAVVLLAVIGLQGCGEMVPRDMQSLLIPKLQRSEILGFIAGFGTTFASVPDLISLLKRRSSTGIKPRMAAIMGIFQIVWVYYGLLIRSRPVIAWNAIAVLVNFLNVAAYVYFVHVTKKRESSSKVHSYSE